ncbi:MAG TPA: hypothetical protein VN253_12970, partial [Kofleriaceae bacterium]|nr:hypothetical protein [Kofleriaceae bacterium]
MTKLGAAGFTSQTAVARVELERVEALHAVGRRIEWLGGHTTLPETAVAWPLKRALARHAVRIDAPASERAALEAEVDRSARLRVAGAG